MTIHSKYPVNNIAFELSSLTNALINGNVYLLRLQRSAGSCFYSERHMALDSCLFLDTLMLHKTLHTALAVLFFCIH